MTIEFLQSIAPGGIGKYSANLHKWIKANAYRDLRIYRRDASPHLYIGDYYDGDFIGVRVMEVLGQRKGHKAQEFCFLGSRFEEVPDFWARYASVGRCIFDPEHRGWLDGAELRFGVTGDNRKCNWCGATQTLHRWEEVVEREEWRMDGTEVSNGE